MGFTDELKNKAEVVEDSGAPAEPPVTDELVEDFAAAGPAVSEPRDAAGAATEEAEELDRHGMGDARRS